MNAPFVRVRGVRPDLLARFKAACRANHKRIKKVSLHLFRVYGEAPEKFAVPPNYRGRCSVGVQFVLGTCPAAAWWAFRAVCVRRNEALPDVVEVLMAAYCRRPDVYAPPYVYRRRRPRRKPRGLMLP